MPCIRSVDSKKKGRGEGVPEEEEAVPLSCCELLTLTLNYFNDIWKIHFAIFSFFNIDVNNM